MLMLMLSYLICFVREDYTAPICVIGLIGFWFNSLEAVKLFFVCIAGTIILDIVWVSIHGNYLHDYGEIHPEMSLVIATLVRTHKFVLAMSIVQMFMKAASLWYIRKFWVTLEQMKVSGDSATEMPAVKTFSENIDPSSAKKLVKGSKYRIESQDFCQLRFVWSQWKNTALEDFSENIDVNCIMLNGTTPGMPQEEDYVWGNKPMSACGSISVAHNDPGKGGSASQVIDVNLAQVKADVKYLVFSVNVHGMDYFRDIAKTTVGLAYGTAARTAAEFEFSGSANYPDKHGCLILCVLMRNLEGQWEQRVLEHPCSSPSAMKVEQLLPDIQRMIKILDEN
jgi:stress response protein SCP2